MMQKQDGRTLRLMRLPNAPRVIRLEDLLETEIRRGACSREIADGLFSGFLKFNFDFVVDVNGKLRWWAITDEDYLALWKKGMIKPNE
jgi:hypothetical protein